MQVNIFDKTILSGLPKGSVKSPFSSFDNPVPGAVAGVKAEAYYGANPNHIPDDLPEELQGSRAVKIDGIWYPASQPIW